ncbi:MAG TPA: protein phosphatase 2C domain-containing protein [Dehalococcoidia bacterium]|nr:protein phosphatase 2C domain-containing protein [Dehalococcoidia bacterium]
MIKWITRGRRNPPGPAPIEADFDAQTDIGRQRDENQDAVLADELPGGRVLLAVADGVGGSADGAAASNAAIKALRAAVIAVNHPQHGLIEGFAAAHKAVLGLVSGEKRPATTLVAAIAEGPRVWIANVGDSRAYLATQAGLRQLTEDHSWVAEQVRAGRLSSDEARTSSMRNVITRAVGTGESPAPDITGPIDLTPVDTLMLSSDGLHGVVPDQTIAVVLNGDYGEETAPTLIHLANEAGGPDNVSVVLYRAY